MTIRKNISIPKAAEKDFNEAEKLATKNKMSDSRYVWMAVVAYNSHNRAKRRRQS